MEFLLESDQPVKGNNLYRYIPKYELTNCVKSIYKGLSNNANIATREAQSYIKTKELNPIGPTHQVIIIDLKKEKKNKKLKLKNKNMKNDNFVNLEVYIKID